jgi:protein O-GlcNAc transferase
VHAPDGDFGTARRSFERQQYTDAVAACEQLLRREPPRPQVLALLGAARQASGNVAASIEAYRECLALDPTNAEVHNNLGTALDRAGQLREAIASFQSAAALKPDYLQAHRNLGKVLRQAGELAAAREALKRALALAPNDPVTLTLLGFVLTDLGDLREAIGCFERAVAIAPAFAEAHHGLGRARLFSGEADSARGHFERALALNPELPEPRLLWGRVLLRRGDPAGAAAAFRRALRSCPSSPELHYQLATALVACGSIEGALPSYEAALALDPDHDAAHLGRGWALARHGRFPQAIASLERACALRSRDGHALSEALFAYACVCDWTNAERIGQRLRELPGGLESANPAAVQALSDDPSEHLRVARGYASRIEHAPPLPLEPRQDHDRIRIAYVSRDFHAHATSYLMAELFELHDRMQFEILGVSFGPADQSTIRRRIARACDQFIDVTTYSDGQIAAWLREQEVDIAIDLKGYTGFARPRIFAYRPAPVQVSYLGYPGTMGAPFINYLIADEFLIPDKEQRCYSESIAYLPDSYQVNDRRRAVSPWRPSRRDAGLPEEGFVFCCFNSSWKITAPVFDVWMRLLRSVGGSVLWLLEDNPDASARLREHASTRGVAPERLVFCGRTGNEAHLSRQSLGDLFLDTLPVNAHTTASDALWMGLPIITCAGRAFPGRVAGSLLRAAGLSELVTSSLAEYEQTALALATDRERLRTIRARLSERREELPLFDTPRFCRNLEAVYREMWRLHREGVAPQTIRATSCARGGSSGG